MKKVFVGKNDSIEAIITKSTNALIADNKEEQAKFIKQLYLSSTNKWVILEEIKKNIKIIYY